MPSSGRGRATAASISMASTFSSKPCAPIQSPTAAPGRMIMNAGSSDVGQAFALRNCDAFFVATVGLAHIACGQRGQGGARSSAAAQNIGREIEVYTVGQVVCRPTQQEAEDYYRHAIIENADWGAIDGMLANKNITPQTVRPRNTKQAPLFRLQRDRRLSVRRHARPRGRGARRSSAKAGMRGIALSFVNYLDEVPYFCDEVLPRLVRHGVRVKH